MSEILQQQDTAVSVQKRNQASLDQTMRELLAKPMDKTLPFEAECRKGACVISRKIDSGDVGDDGNIKCFEKAKTSINYFKDLLMSEIISVDAGNKESILAIAKHIGIVDSLFNYSVFGGSIQVENSQKDITVQFPLKEVHGEVKHTKARFTSKNIANITLTKSDHECKLTHAVDIENNAVFLRWTMNANGGKGLNPDISECLIIFNKSHQLNISTVLIPGMTEKVPSSVNILKLLGKTARGKFNQPNTSYSTTYDPDQHDPTLFFLKRKFPSKRYISSTGNDQSIINEHDIGTQEAHIRKCTWEIVYLHWVYEALCSVGYTIGLEEENIPQISLLQHDTMLLAIAVMAAKITDLFKNLKYTVKSKPGEETDSQDTAESHTAVEIQYRLANLVSPYNSTIAGLTSDKYNTADYFGYKLTQWLLTTVEKCTILIPKKDVNTPRSKEYRAQLRRVHCTLSRSAIRTTYTTDVLLGLSRKSFIDPWGAIYESIDHLPEILKKYSLRSKVQNAGWAVDGSIAEKQVSVVLKSTHMVQFTFHAFRRDFHGINPVAVSNENKNGVSKPRKFKKNKKPNTANKEHNKMIRDSLQPLKGLQKSLLLNPNAGEPSASPFVFGAAVGPYSWNKVAAS